MDYIAKHLCGLYKIKISKVLQESMDEKMDEIIRDVFLCILS